MSFFHTRIIIIISHTERENAAAHAQRQTERMAKLGEGDERWIVEEKGRDGVNVNGWHWQELDCLSWAKVCLYERQLRGVCTCLLVRFYMCDARYID